jgi:hypothetical protein
MRQTKNLVQEFGLFCSVLVFTAYGGVYRGPGLEPLTWEISMKWLLALGINQHPDDQPRRDRSGSNGSRHGPSRPPVLGAQPRVIPGGGVHAAPHHGAVAVQEPGGHLCLTTPAHLN